MPCTIHNYIIKKNIKEILKYFVLEFVSHGFEYTTCTETSAIFSFNSDPATEEFDTMNPIMFGRK